MRSSIIFAIYLLPLIDLGCAEHGPPTIAAPPPAVALAPLGDHSELEDYKRECANPSFSCAPLVAGGSDCACEVPQTGYSLPGFEEVDILMRQFMKFRDVGAATLAIRYQDRLVYKRGFGRTEGDWDAVGAPLVPPDAAMKIGSVSKNIGAAVMRELVEARIAEAGFDATYPSVGSVPLLVDLDPGTVGCQTELECLLPEDLHARYGARDIATMIIDDLDPCPRANPFVADSRWTSVTLADVLGHSAGLPGSAPSETVVYGAIPVLREYFERDAWEADEDALAALNPGLVAAMNDARQVIATELGVAPGDVYFVNRYDHLAGGDPSHEVLELVAGRCLAADPLGATDASPSDRETGYSNTMGSFVERVIDHLHPSGRFSGWAGMPELHAGSALEQFIASELGVDRGVESIEGIFGAQNQPGLPASGWARSLVEPRVWNDDAGSWYAATERARSRPFCVFDDGTQSCGFSDWSNTASLRPPWDFALDGVGKIAKVQAWRRGWDLHATPGGLLAEMPLLALWGDRFVIDWSSHKGRRLSECSNCPVTLDHNGALGGAFAEVTHQQVGDTYDDVPLPPRDAHGRITDAMAEAQLEDVASFSLPGRITFAVALNQNSDPGCTSGLPEDDGGAPDDLAPLDPLGCDAYVRLPSMIKYALSRVDWGAVDQTLGAENRRIQALAMVDTASATYLMADDDAWVRQHAPDVHRDSPKGIEIAMQLPSTRVAGNIIGAGYDDDGRLFTYYDDGRVSATYAPHVDFDLGGLATPGGGATPSRALELDALGAPGPFTIRPDMRLRDVLDVAITDGYEDTVTVTYYRDGYYSRGTLIDLDAHGVDAYTLPPGQLTSDLVGVAMADGDHQHVWARYRDGSVSRGTLGDLDALGHWPGQIADLAMNAAHDTALVYRSGFVRWLAGTPSDNWPLETNAVVKGWEWLATHPQVAADAEIVGVGFGASQSWIATDDDILSRRALSSSGRLDHWQGATRFGPSWGGQPGELDDIVGLAGSAATYLWWGDGAVTTTDGADLALSGPDPYGVAPWQGPAQIVGVAKAPEANGYVYTLFKDGSLAIGTPTDLDRAGYKKKPLVLLGP